jgi:hypothetical protein
VLLLKALGLFTNCRERLVGVVRGVFAGEAVFVVGTDPPVVEMLPRVRLVPGLEMLPCNFSVPVVVEA